MRLGCLRSSINECRCLLSAKQLISRAGINRCCGRLRKTQLLRYYITTASGRTKRPDFGSASEPGFSGLGVVLVVICNLSLSGVCRGVRRIGEFRRDQISNVVRRGLALQLCFCCG